MTAAWERFAESPENYPQLPDLLRRARPEQTDSLFSDESPWPQANEQPRPGYARPYPPWPASPLRKPATPCAGWSAEHDERRGWVWARLGQAPLAEALQATERTGRPDPGPPWAAPHRRTSPAIMLQGCGR